MKIIIIGAGPAGVEAALKAAKHGHDVSLFSTQDLGGVCLNEGCIPTKSLLEDAFHLVKTSKLIENFKPIDAAQSIIDHKNKLIQDMQSSLKTQLVNAKVKLIISQAWFIDDTHIQDELGQSYCADVFIIATGATFSVPKAFLAIQDQLLNSRKLLTTTFSKHQYFCVIGAGVIGVELAAYLNMMGHRVTMIENTQRFLPSAPLELASSLQRDFIQNGIEIKLNEQINDVSIIDGKFKVSSLSNSSLYDQVLLATGRKPNIESLKLENTHVKFSEKGIEVNEFYQSNCAHIYAIGDVNGGIQLAHVASHQAEQLIDYLTSHIKPQQSVIPYGVYTPLQLSWAGLTEEEAKGQPNVHISKTLISSLAKQKIKVNTRGYIKCIYNDQYHLLGVEILSADATELISTFTLMIEQKINLLDAAKLIFPHPTLSEAIKLSLTQNLHLN